VKVKPQWVNQSEEWLTYSVEPVGDDSAQVNIRWEKINVPFTVKVPDVAATTMAHLKNSVSNAKADDWQTPMLAGNYLINNQNTADDEQGMAWIEQSIKVK